MNGIKSEDHKDRFIKSTRFLCLALIIKYTSKTMDVMGLSLVIRVNYKKKNSYLNNYCEMDDREYSTDKYN